MRNPLIPNRKGKFVFAASSVLRTSPKSRLVLVVVLNLVKIDALEAYFNSMEDYIDSDTFLESEYKSNQESTTGYNCDTDDENLKPKLSEVIYDD
jgi:hypothetical protein